MWLGPNTDDCYEDIFSLVCEKHKDNKHEIRSKNKILKMLKETVVIMRVKSMSFLLEDQDACEIFESRTFRLWLADHQIFPSEFKFGLDQKKCHKEVVLLIDSVMVFTMALFSKICSICTKIKRIWDLNSHREKQGSNLFPEDKKKIFEYILSSNENHPHYLSVRKAFQGYDRVTVDFAFVVAYYTFITTFGDGISVGQYLRDTNDDFNIQRMLDVIHEVNHLLINKLCDVAFFQISSELRMNHYFSILYENGAHVAMIEKDFACAELCCRFALVLDMECCHSFFMLTSALLAQKEIHRAHATAAFASKQCKVWTCKHCVTLKKVAEEFKKMCEECNPEEKPSVLTNAKEKAASSRSASKYSSFKEIFDSIGLNAEVVCKLLNLTEETPNGCVRSIVKNESEMDQHVKVPASEQCRDQKNLILTRPKVKKPDKDNFLKKQEVTSELKQPEGSMCAIEKEAEKADRIENSDKLAIEKALLEGRCAIKTGCMEKAVSHFSEVLNMIKKSPKLSETLKIDATAIKFVYGYTCFKCFTLEHMNRAITIFKEIIDSGAKHVAAVHYFLGLSFSKFQKFQTALTYFETATSMKKEEFNFNLFALLDENSSTEFKYENIQVSLKDEIAKCECPPPPDAICRYDTCNFDTSIYFSGLSFKKCTCLHCQERCVLQYHFTCWKLIKESSAKTEKDFLDSPCLTPDCIGLIIKIEIIKKNGEVEKEFVSKEDSRPKRHGKSKKMDMEEKTEQKERERKESRSRTISKNFEDEPELVSDGKHSKESVKSQGYKNDAHEKFSVENEVLKCKSFPHPDAVCRYESCNQNREIYFSHLSSEVFICVRCQKQCAIEYHVPCWKAQKKALCKIDDDEFLDSACFTPDCDSVITKIDVFGRDGVWERHFTSKDNYKPKTKKRVKQRKLKLEKKQEQKERKRQEVLSHIMSGNFEPSSDESEPTIENSLSTEPHAMPIKNTYHRKVSDNNYALAIAGNAKPSTSNVNAHKKEHNSISPKKEQKRPKIFSSPPKDFGNWSETYIAKSPVTSLSEFIDFEVSSKIDTASKTDDLSDIWCYKDELKTMIISHFLNFLRCHGFISLNDPKLDQEIHKLPKDAIEVINEEGGFYEFFCDFTEFEFVNGNFCLYSDVRDLCEFDDSICEMSPSKVQEDVHISAGSRNITKIQATANQDNLLENGLCQKEYKSKDISGAVEVSACNRSATHKVSKHVPSGARNQTISMSSYTEEYESSAESDPEDYYSRSSYFSKIDASHSPKLFELKENPLSSNAAGKKHHLDSDDVNKKSETVPKFLKDNVEDDLNEIGWKNRNGYETGRSLTEPKNYMDEICQLSQFVPSQEKSAAFEVNATHQAEASIKIEKKKKESASKQKVPEAAAKQKVPEAAAKQKVPEAAAKQKVPEAAAKQKVPEAAAKQKVPEAAAKQKVPEAAAKQKVPEAAAKQKVPEAAAKQKVPEAAAKQKVPEAAAKQKVPEAAAKQKVPEAAAKQKVPEAAAKQKVPEAAAKQKVPEAAAKQKVPEAAAKQKVPEAAAKQKVPEAAAKQKVPEAAAKQKVPEAAAKQKVPEAAAKQKVPEAAAKQKVPEAAAKQKVPEAAAKQKVPEAAAKQKVPEAAAKQKVPEAAAKQKVPEAAAKQKVPEAAAKQKGAEAAAKQKGAEAASKQKAKESVPEQKIQIPIHSHHIDKETESHIENKILHIQNTVTDKYEKQIENEIAEESAGQSVSLGGIEEIQNAELEILDKKRVEYLKVFEAALLNAETNVQDLKSGLTQMEYMYRFVQSTMNQMQDRFNEYIIDLYDLRNTFNNEVTAQIEKIKSGALLSQLEKLDVPTFPPLPTIDSVLCEVNLNRTSPNAEGAATNAQSQLSTEATSPQGSSQFPSEFMQSCYSHMFQQNLLITKNSGVYSVNDNQTCKVPSLLQTTSAAASVQEQPLVTESSSKSVPVNDFFNNSTTVSHQNHPQAPKSVDNVASCEVIAKSPPLHTENMQPEIATSSKISQSGAKSFPEPNKTRQLKCSTSEISQDDGKSFSQQMTPLHETKHQKSSVTSEISESNIESLSQIIKPFDKNMQPKSGPSSELQGSIEFVSEAINQLHENAQSKNKTSSETSQMGAESLPQTIKPLKNMKLKEKPLSKPSEEVKSLSQVLRHLSKIKKLKSTASLEISIIADETLPQAIKPVHESMQPKSKVSSEISKSLPQAIKPVHESMQPKSKVSSEISKSLPQAVKPVHENIQPKSDASSEISQTSAKSLPQTIKPVHENIQPKSDVSSEISQTNAKSLSQTIKPLHKSMQPKNKASTEIFQSDAKSSSRVSCESISSGSFYDYEDSASIKSSLIFSNSVEKSKSEIEFVNEKSAKKSNPVDDAAASMVMAKTERIRTMCKKIIHAVKQEFPNAKDSEIMTYVKQYRTEKGGKLPSVTLATIVADVKEIMMCPKKKVANMGTSSQVEYPVCSNQGTASAADTKIRTVVPEPKNFHAATSEYINACEQPTYSASSSLKSSSSDQMAHPKGKTLSELYTKKQAEDTAKLQSFLTHSVMDAKKMLIGSNGAQHDRNTTLIKSATTESALKHCDNDLRKGNSRSASKDRKTDPQRIGTSSQVEYPVCSLQGAASAADTKIRTVVPEPKNFHAATSEYINACEQPTYSASSSLKSSSSDQMAYPKGKTLSELYTKEQAEDTAKLQSFLTHFVMDAKKMLIGTNGAQHDRNTTLIKSATTESALKHSDNDPRKGNSRSASEDRKTDPQRILTYPKLSRQKKLTNKPLTSCSKPKPPPKTEKKKPSFCPWAKVPNPEDKSNGDYESSEHVCCICFEEMTILTARTTDCGHKFHLKCIKAWCDKQSDCPICRAHLLLYEDFPILS